jgi:hypothetical protein
MQTRLMQRRGLSDRWVWRSIRRWEEDHNEAGGGDEEPPMAASSRGVPAPSSARTKRRLWAGTCTWSVSGRSSARLPRQRCTSLGLGSAIRVCHGRGGKSLENRPAAVALVGDELGQRLGANRQAGGI